MDIQWINLIVGGLLTLITSGAIYFGLNKKLKAAEVKEKEAEVLRKQDDEWQDLYHEARDQKQKLEEIVEQLRKDKAELASENGKLELRIQQLMWFRCKVNNCPNRKPPHVFDIEGNEFESQEKED